VPDPTFRPADTGTARFAERLALYFGALFLIYGVHITYFPVWLASRGLSPENIGLITALPIFIRTVATPLIAARADRHANHRDMIIILSIASAALALAMSQFASFWPLLLLSVPFAIAISSIMPLTETIAVDGVRRAGHDYGRMRLWGSATFLIATAVTGVLFDAFGAGVGIYVLIVATALTMAAAFALPRPDTPAPSQEPDGDSLDLTPESGQVLTLLTTPVFALFLLSVGAIMGSHSTFYTFGALHLKAQGVSGMAFSSLWAIAIFAEMALLASSLPLVARLGPARMIMIGGIAAVIRWGAMSLDPPFYVLMALQILHALTYGAVHVGAMHFIAQAIPNRATGAAQALYSSIGSGLLTGAATLAAGHLYPHLGGQTFLAMAALAAAGVAGAIAIDKTWDRKLLLTPTGGATPAQSPRP
jgi:MFS transporter, PPP family, 3-phenylpropionic acid transporter